MCCAGRANSAQRRAGNLILCETAAFVKIMAERCITPLSEKDVPGAALNGRDPETLTVPELKQCKNASLKGKKADLVAW